MNDRREEFASEIRTALGPLNDWALPVVILVEKLRDELLARGFQKLASSGSEPSPKPGAREAPGERSTAVVGLQRAEASGVGSEMKAEGAGNATKADEPTATPVDSEVTAAIGLPAAGDPQSELVLLAALSDASEEVRAEALRFDPANNLAAEVQGDVAFVLLKVIKFAARNLAANKAASVQPNDALHVQPGREAGGL